MHSERHRTISNSGSSEGTEPITVPEPQTRNRNNSDQTTKARIHRSRLPQVDVTRREKSASCTTEYASRRTMKARSLTPGCQKPRQFVTGIDYRTKFMRETSRDTGQELAYSSDARNLQQTREDTRTVSKWRPNSAKACLVKQPTREEDAKTSTSAVGPNHPQLLPNRTPPEFNNTTAAVRMKHVTGHSGAQAKRSGKTKPPCTANKMATDAKENQETKKAGEILTCHKPSRAASPFIHATKTEATVTYNEEITARLRMNKSPCFSLDLEVTNGSVDPHNVDKCLHGINKADLWINLPNSPSSEPRGSNSLHTTPRSPRLVQKNPSNSFLYSAISETLSPKARNSIPYLEMQEMQRTSSQRATVSCSPKPPGPSKKHKVLPSSDVTLTTKTWGTVSNESRTKTPSSTPEPMTFTTQFVPLLRWTDKTNPGGLFEPQAHHGSNSSLNSTANDKSHVYKLLNQPFKEASMSGNGVKKERYRKQQQIAANEDYNILQPSLTDIPGEGEKITNATMPKKKSMTQDENPPKDTDRSRARNRLPIVKKALKLTGPQQAVSGCALRPATNSQLPKRPQSMKTITMTKQPSAYTRNTTQALGDFTRRPMSAGFKGKMKEATVNKKPVWK